MSISFRSAKSQASPAVRSMTAHGTARHDNQDSGKIHSLGTERAYEQALAGLTEWIQENKLGDLKGLDEATARHYLGFLCIKVRNPPQDLAPVKLLRNAHS